MVKFSEKSLKLISSASALPGPPVTNEQLYDALKKHCNDSSGSTVSSKIKRAKAIARQLSIQNRHLTRRLDMAVSKSCPDAPELGLQVPVSYTHLTLPTTPYV